ncbi:hypothetical protein ACFL55_01380 [Candidatus Latescibacterota bacterium]
MKIARVETTTAGTVNFSIEKHGDLYCVKIGQFYVGGRDDHELRQGLHALIPLTIKVEFEN